MSRENVNLVQRVFEAAAGGEAGTVLSLYHEDVEFGSTRSPLPSLVGGREIVYRGHEGLRRFFRERSEHMSEISDQCEELIEVGDKVVSVVTTRARGRASGVEVTGPRYAAVWTVKEGKILRVVWLPTREDALRAAELSD